MVKINAEAFLLSVFIIYLCLHLLVWVSIVAESKIDPLSTTLSLGARDAQDLPSNR